MSIDLVLATSVFISLLIIFNTFWSLFLSYSQYAPLDMTADSQRLMNYFLISPGYPSNWTSSNVQLIGLSYPPGVIQQSKLTQLLNMSTPTIQNLTGTTEYNLYMNMTYTNGTMVTVPINSSITMNATLGSYPANYTQAASSRGVAMYSNNSKRVIINVILWQ